MKRQNTSSAQAHAGLFPSLVREGCRGELVQGKRKTHHSHNNLIQPFQGRNMILNPFPRVLPWAIRSYPFGVLSCSAFSAPSPRALRLGLFFNLRGRICANRGNQAGIFNRQYNFLKSSNPIHKSLFHGLGTIKVHDMFPCNSLPDNHLTPLVNQESVKISKTGNSLKTKDLSTLSHTNKPCFTASSKHFHIC